MDESKQKKHLDSAQALHKLILQINSVLQRPFGDGNKISAKPLHQSFDKIARELEYDNYIEFLKQFMELCDKVEYDLKQISFRREELRKKYERSLYEIRSVFSSKNFSENAILVFRRHFSQDNIYSLVEISDRYESESISEVSIDELSASLDAVREILRFTDEQNLLSERLKRIVDIHLSHLNDIVKSYETFGERDFWIHYKVIFASFSQIIGDLNEQNSKEYTDKLKKILGHIIFASSITANAVTLGSPIVGLLAG